MGEIDVRRRLPKDVAWITGLIFSAYSVGHFGTDSGAYWRGLRGERYVSLTYTDYHYAPVFTLIFEPLARVLPQFEFSVLPSDYVIVVDTSGSMTQDGRYDKVKTALTAMLTALQPTDRVALVTFDSATKVAYDGPAGTDPAALVAKLPSTPTGQLTDIGAGIDAGLKILEADNAKDLGAIALITDGKVDAPGSPYADPASPAWAALRTRADALAAKHQVAAYALSLISATDAALLRQPFPDAVDISADQFSARLSALQGELLKFQAGEALKPELDRGVTATFAGIDWTALPRTGSVSGTVKLTSSYQQIPVTVTGLALTAVGADPLAFDPLPAEVALAPGASADVSITVRTGTTGVPSAGAAPSTATVTTGASAGPSAAADTTTVTLTGIIASPWQTVLIQDLNLAFAPKVTATATARVVKEPTPATPAAMPWPLIGGVGGAAAVALLLLLALRSRGPNLVGSLAVSQNGRPVREFLLTGRSADLADPTTPGLTGHVTAQRTKNGQPAVVVHSKGNKQQPQVTLSDRQSAEIGSYAVTYTAQRTRMISMIQAGLEDDGNS